MSDLDLRLVRYFTTVAAHLHYGRAAAELHIAQPSLSRQIRLLETHMGVRLLDRTRQGTTLTEAGQAFLPRATALLRAADEATAAARSAARPTLITVGYTSGLMVTAAVARLRENRADADVRTLFLDWNEPHDALVDGRVDAAVTRLPLRGEGLDVTVLYDEPKMLLLPVGHRLAGKESVTLGDIEGEPIPRFPDPEWDAYWRVDPRPDGRPAPGGPPVATIADKVEAVASGQAVAIIPAALHAGGMREDLTAVPLYGVDPGQVVVATRAGDRSPLVTAFRAAARERLRG